MKKFNLDFKNRFQEELLKKRKVFEEISINLIESGINSYFKNIFYNFLPKDSTVVDKNIDYRELINLNVFDPDNFKLFVRKNYYCSIFFHNEINFLVKYSNCPPSSDRRVFNDAFYKKKLLYSCKKEFFDNKENNEQYNEVSDFQCFEDTYTKKQVYFGYGSIKLKSNVNGWLNYHEKLMDSFLLKYGFVKRKDKEMVRYIKKINDYYLGIEYNESRFKKEIKRDYPCLPEYYNIIFFNDSFNYKLADYQYEAKGEENILSLGILGNPLFYPPTFPLKNFCVIDMFFDENNKDNRIEKYEIELNEMEGDLFKASISENYSENIKKHAFFELKCLEYSSLSYLEFIKGAVDSVL